jgi:hypothetical protein
VINKPDPIQAKDQLQALQTMLKGWGIRAFLASMFWILAKNLSVVPGDETEGTRLVPFMLNRMQSDLDANIARNNRLLKARQSGGTTYFMIRRLLLPVLTEGGKTGMLISQNNDYATKHFRIAHRAYDYIGALDPFDRSVNTLCEELKANLLHTQYSSRKELVFDVLDSQIIIESAEVEEAGQGVCVASDTLICTADFRLIRYKDLKAGDEIRGSGGKYVRVCKVHTIPAAVHPRRGDARSICLAGLKDQPIRCASNHPFMTQRGMVTADMLVPGKDYFKYPKVPILSRVKNVTFSTASEFRSAPMGFGHTLPLDREFGFLCGLYLADGALRGNRVVGITMIAPHKRKEAVPRILKIVKDIGLGYGDTGTCLLIYSSLLCTWLEDNFGRTKQKHIPLWWAMADREFLLGVLEGWLFGDGEVPKPGHRPKRYVLGYGKNLTLLMGMKELSVSLDFGMPRLSKRKIKEKYRSIKGVRCHVNGPMYTLKWGGDSFYALAGAFGYLQRTRSVQGRKVTNYQDKDFVYTQVVSVKKIRLSEFKDITVDAADHLYCLPYGLTHNTLHHVVCSEVARWPGLPEETVSNIKGGLVPGGTFDEESTGNGAAGYFYEQYLRSMDDPLKADARAHFYNWTWTSEFELPLTESEKDELEKDLQADEYALIRMMHKELDCISSHVL